MIDEQRGGFMKILLKRTFLLLLFLSVLFIQTLMANITAAAQAEDPAKVTSQVIPGRNPYPADVPFMVVMYGSSDVIDLVDIHGNLLNRLETRQILPNEGITSVIFAPDCGEIILDGNTLVDVDGNIIRQWPDDVNIDLFIRQTNFSLTGDRIAYLNLWFDDGYDPLYGHGDLVVRSWPDLTNFIQLTHNGGSAPYTGYWSPNGDRIAYTDFDENGILELYAYTFSTSITQQITHGIFEDEYRAVSWLPDNQTLIYRIHNRDTGEYSPNLMSWNVVSGEAAPVQNTSFVGDDQIIELSREYWLDDGVTGLSLVAAQTESGQEWVYSTWFDIQTREIIQQIVLQPSEQFFEEINSSYFLFLLNDYTIGGIASPNSLIEFNLAAGVAQPWYVTEMSYFPMEMPPAAVNGFYSGCVQSAGE
jgi:hypothetical protein